MSKQQEEVFFNKNLDRAEHILQLLEDTFGQGSVQAEASMKRYTQIMSPGTVEATKMAATYLEWCVAHPPRIGQRNALKHCVCDNGWVLHEKEPVAYRPCQKCLPATYDKWMGVEYDDDDEDDGFEGF
jgi:hypothetical protein